MDSMTSVTKNALLGSHIMKVKFKVYTYITPEHEPGTLIVHPDLTTPFDEKRLFEMDDLVVNEISLADILRKGFIKLGSTDIMEDMDIEYPLVPNEVYKKNRITGKHWDYTPRQVADMIGLEFDVDDTAINSDSDTDENLENDAPVNPADANPVEFVEISDDGIYSDPEILDTALDDGKMDEILGKIQNCEDTAVKDVDRLLDVLGV